MNDHSSDASVPDPEVIAKGRPENFEPVIREGDMDFDHMIDVERRIRASEPVTDEERQAYEKVSANIKDTLKNFRMPSTAFQMPKLGPDITDSILRGQRAYLDDFVKKLQKPFSTQVDVPSFTTEALWRAMATRELHLGRTPSDVSNEPPELDEDLALNPEAIETEPVELAALMMSLADHMKQQTELADRRNEIAEQHIQETRHLHDIMALVKDQSDKQGTFATRMAWFMAAVGVGTIVIPIVQWIWGTQD